MKFSGIDLHSNNSMVVISDEEDRVVYRRRLPNELGLILVALAPYRDELAGVVVEATYNWCWLVDGLMAAGHTMMRIKYGLPGNPDVPRIRALRHVPQGIRPADRAGKQRGYGRDGASPGVLPRGALRDTVLLLTESLDDERAGELADGFEVLIKVMQTLGAQE